MTSPRIELANGGCDDVNRSFYTSMPYVESTVQVFLNGLLQQPSAYSLSPPQFLTLVDAPRAGEIVQVYYAPR